MKAHDLICAIRMWESHIPKRDEDLRVLKRGFAFLADVHAGIGSKIYAGHFRRELGAVEDMIEARKEGYRNTQRRHKP